MLITTVIQCRRRWIGRLCCLTEFHGLVETHGVVQSLHVDKEQQQLVVTYRLDRTEPRNLQRQKAGLLDEFRFSLNHSAIVISQDGSIRVTSMHLGTLTID